uniref:Lamina-associated polypeptide 2-like n=1 Tax=Ciona intestinalis TaxID=7719 RepID=F6Z509_CIOIN|nr:lamina-associated polypeptide 2-like isoform X2 [Ciona intestinalis]|eukprot:XP_009861364.1 lamina-associated polypeptide 2-like isoform X2 [Ciona intestinalis]
MPHPDDMTKEEIKEQLLAHGVSLPHGNAHKATYVKLYNMHVENQSGSFSSDDEALDNLYSKKVNIKKTYPKEWEITNIEQLTNEEISIKLRFFGMVPGPIGPSTRNVYLKKLEKFMSEKRKDIAHQYSDDEEDVENEVIVVKATLNRNRHTSSQPVNTRKSNINHEDIQPGVSEKTTFLSQPPNTHDASSATTRRPLHPCGDAKKMTKPQDLVRDDKIKQEHHWMPVWLQVLVASIIAGFIYLVFQTMESNPAPLSLPTTNSD